ncbi:unnamed protein product [Protopolystoma xenopodis]|uniref:Uncharacterized protein n=1 Tax=Protopolystoma xenopodis TaxID=117903 RepID=A0A448X3Q9_9PLAT|nr:unnamed protein product [Protopolystoma xenopodis]
MGTLPLIAEEREAEQEDPEEVPALIFGSAKVTAQAIPDVKPRPLVEDKGESGSPPEEVHSSLLHLISKRSIGKFTRAIFPWMNRRKPYWVDQFADPSTDHDLSFENNLFLKQKRLEEHLSRGETLRVGLNSQNPWVNETQRCGLVAIKIGMYPLWTKQGRKLDCTLLQARSLLY